MKSLFSLFFAMVSLAVSAQQPFSISGELKALKLPAEKVYLYYANGSDRVTDSAVVTNGQYQFKGTIAEPNLGRLRIKYAPDTSGKMRAIDMNRDLVALFLDASNLKAVSTDSFSNITITGSASHKAYQSLQAQLKPLEDQQRDLSRQYSALYQKKDTAGMKAMESKFDDIDKLMKTEYKKYLAANPQSPVALYALSQFAGWEINAEEVEPLFVKLPENVRKRPSAVELAEKIEIAKKTGIGKFAMDFTQNDTLGKPVSLSSFKGKYILIDFWASWCGPCRQENPNVVKAYNQFKDRGFHIIGVSLDQPNAKDKWIKAIHDDQLAWTHVSDLQYWKNAVAVQYGIQAIPQNLLLDKEGRIIAKNLRGEELAKKLEELLKP